MNEWRRDPATDAQKRRIKDEGLKFKRGMTKGEASDLIGTTEEANDWQIECLKFFKVKGSTKMCQTDARRKLDELFADEDNQVYKHFEIKIPARLKHKDAEQFIDELFEDSDKAASWDIYENRLLEKEDQKEELEDLRQDLNDSADLYDCKKLNKTQSKKVIKAMEDSGVCVDDILNYDNLRKYEPMYFKYALKHYPDIRRKSPGSRRKRKAKSKSSDTAIGYLIVIIFIIYVASKI